MGNTHKANKLKNNNYPVGCNYMEASFPVKANYAGSSLKDAV